MSDRPEKAIQGYLFPPVDPDQIPDPASTAIARLATQLKPLEVDALVLVNPVIVIMHSINKLNGDAGYILQSKKGSRDIPPSMVRSAGGDADVVKVLAAEKEGGMPKERLHRLETLAGALGNTVLEQGYTDDRDRLMAWLVPRMDAYVDLYSAVGPPNVRVRRRVIEQLEDIAQRLIA